MFSLFSLSFLLSACEPPPPPVPGEMERTGDVIKVVNGKNVTKGMVDVMLDSLPPGTKDQLIARNQLDQLNDQVVTTELLYQEALKKKYEERPAVKSAIAMAERQALISAMLDDVIAEKTTDAAVQAWYDEHAVQFKRPQVKARHILVKDEAEAKAIYDQIKGGADFAKLATEKSTDPGSGKEGGELGWFEKGRMVKEFADAAFAAKKGDLIGPVKSQFGYHIIEVEDARDAIPVSEVSDKIKSQMRGEVIQKYIEEVKKGATITDPAGSAGSATVTPAAGGAAPAAPAAGGAAPAPTTK